MYCLPVAATVQLTTGLLPLLAPRMAVKPTTTKRTPPLREHFFSSSEPREEKQTGRARKEQEQKGKAIEIET
jgi:hypothetical protein